MENDYPVTDHWPASRHLYGCSSPLPMAYAGYTSTYNKHRPLQRVYTYPPFLHLPTEWDSAHDLNSIPTPYPRPSPSDDDDLPALARKEACESLSDAYRSVRRALRATGQSRINYTVPRDEIQRAIEDLKDSRDLLGALQATMSATHSPSR